MFSTVQYTISGKTYIYRIYSTGVVTDDKGVTIC